jgi:hypothetical protein
VRTVSDVVVPGSAHIYTVRALRAGTLSPDSNRDLATAILFAGDPLVPRVTRVAALHVTQLRSAVDAVRALAGFGAAAYTDPGLARGYRIRAVHITEVRAALDQARANLGLPPLAYQRQPLTTSHRIHHLDVMELRGGVK